METAAKRGSKGLGTSRKEHEEIELFVEAKMGMLERNCFVGL